VLFEGDGSLLMHIQELEMVQRHGIKLLICVLNDGAYVSQLKGLFDTYQAQGTAEIWIVHISDQVVSPSTRRTVGHGKM